MGEGDCLRHHVQEHCVEGGEELLLSLWRGMEPLGHPGQAGPLHYNTAKGVKPQNIPGPNLFIWTCIHNHVGHLWGGLHKSNMLTSTFSNRNNRIACAIYDNDSSHNHTPFS